MAMVVGILAIVLLGAVVLVALAFGGSYLLNQLFGRTSGLNRLAQLYPVDRQIEGEVYHRQKVAIANMYYANTADVGITPDGLYLWVRPFLSKYEPALIPWGELRNPQPTILALQSAVRLTIGDPQVTTIVLTRRLYESVSPHLRG